MTQQFSFLYDPFHYLIRYFTVCSYRLRIDLLCKRACMEGALKMGGWVVELFAVIFLQVEPFATLL